MTSFYGPHEECRIAGQHAHPSAQPYLSNIYAFQKVVARWAAVAFPNSSPQTKLLHLKEEVDELLKAEAAHGDVESEAADILLILLHYAESHGFSLMAAALAKFEVVKARKWGPPDAQGVVRHEPGS